jgi:pimeloyl-ACP methyl ester carboxylesterase
MESMLTPTDAALQVGTGEFHEFFLSCTQHGLAPGSQGWWDDSSMQLRPWGFDLADIAVPLLLLHGRRDMFSPSSHGEWLAQHIPGVEARLLNDDGHATVVNRVPEVHAWLSEHL